MPTAPDQQVPPGTAPSRGRDDACPGALRLHAADDGALARVRVPGGVLDARQARALGAAAARFGDGELHLTSRGNAQLRGLGSSCGASLAELLAAAGLLPSAAHERVRNVVASPLSGLDGRGHLDVRPWLRELDALLCGSTSAAALSGRFLFALDDGRGDVAALAADVTLRAAPDGAALLGLGRHAPVRVRAAEAPRAALLAAERFATAAPSSAWRVADLPDGGAALSAELARALGAPGAPAAAPGSGAADGVREGGGPALGIIGQLASPVAALSVLAPLGRLTAAQWDALVALADRTADGELRLTPWRGVVVPGVHEGRARAESAALAVAGLVTDARSPWFGVSACAGRPGCAKSLADVRADAAAAVRSDPGPAASGRQLPLPVHWSGCSRGCGRPRGDRVDVVATPDGYRVGVVRDGAPAAGRASQEGAADLSGTATSVPVSPVSPVGADGGPQSRVLPDLAATVAAARRGAVSR